MSENYDVYRHRQRRTHKSRSSKENTYAKKLKKQIFISSVCLTLVYLIKMTNSGIENSIKSALDYEVDTAKIRSGITTVLDNMLQKEEKTDKNSTNGETINEQTNKGNIYEDI